MVGDQCQLPATVLSAEAQRRGLDVSLFERMLTLGMEVHMLGIQYRMHPLIAHFPSWRFVLYSPNPYSLSLSTCIATLVHDEGWGRRAWCRVSGPVAV